MDPSRPRPVRLALVRSVIFLLLGSATILPAAFGMAWIDWRDHRGGTPKTRYDVVESGEVIGHAYVMRAGTTVNIGRLQIVAPSNGGSIGRPSWATGSPPGGFTAVTTSAGGWPLYWLRTEGWVDHDAAPPRLVQAGWQGWTGVLPLGFAGNTAIFAAFWATLFIGFVRTRRWWHRRRGRCPMCAYSLAGLSDPGCPNAAGCAWRPLTGPLSRSRP